MIFFRYQNTKTLERYSFEYIDMNRLYDLATFYISFHYKKEATTKSLDDILFEYLECYCRELSYRQNLTEDKFDYILREVIKITLKYYDENTSAEEDSINRENAWNEISFLMREYPMKGIFTIPEYCERFESGTKYSIAELRSNVIVPISAKSAKYLAVYEGDVICDEMEYGGTLIKPRKLIQVFDLFKETDRLVDTCSTLYRNLIYDEKRLSESIKMAKSQIRECLDFEEDKLIKVHVRELLLKEILLRTKANYKQLQYRNLNNSHLMLIHKGDKVIKIYIPERKITIENVLNGDNIVHYGKLYITDHKKRTVSEKTFKLNMTV